MGSAGKDLFIVMALIVGLGFVSVYISEVNKSGPNSTTSRSSIPRYQESTYVDPSAEEQEIYAGGEDSAQLIEEELEKAKNELEAIRKELEKIEKYGETSPYAGMITMSRQTTGPRYKNVDWEYIQLNANKNNKSDINISKWRLTSTVTGKSIEIGEAVHLLYSGRVNSSQPVSMRPKDRAYIVTGRSPNGYSFMINLCSGYFEQFQNFHPKLANQCPQPEVEIDSYYDTGILNDDVCLDYVEKIRQCSAVTGTMPIYLSQGCQDAIVTKLNYNSCVDMHRNDPGFYRLEWRIFLKREEELWKSKREIIKLLDETGKVVDYISY